MDTVDIRRYVLALYAAQRVCFDYIVCFVSIFTQQFIHLGTLILYPILFMCVLDMVLGKVSKIII